ncbi:aromatic amino acid ammonia-lyase [Hyalangium minutum]|uniref:Histidine ammonia-lyase n=1 Tax=Hyalangium minutum TaxID=394096 RepID=A0A085WIS4_9BACT|nr:aromatic amino acid ammonia-lyase [Hyalangium minutum]KFE67587.1 Histidine ammonia-lyase [Hyalangium minutum]
MAEVMGKSFVDEVSLLLEQVQQERALDLLQEEQARMRVSVQILSERHAAGERIYGVTQGFGPLVTYEASSSGHEQGMNLLAHLGTSQGPALSPDVTRLLFWLRLQGLRRGYSAVEPAIWRRLAEAWNRGFVPVVCREGTVSASGDLQPLAQAALALAGVGEAWHLSEGGAWERVPAARKLEVLGLPRMEWGAREALAFVNGTTASLAATCFNHQALLRMARALAAITGRMARLLGANPEAYHPHLSAVRGQEGQRLAAAWIREECAGLKERAQGRPLQEPYSLRCAPQVIGAVLGELRLHGEVLAAEARGCTDNPVVVDGQVLHGGNFHAMPVALASDMYGLCVQQLAFLAERQLAVLLTPETNGGLPPMLTPRPGAFSGLAGVQVSATSFVARIRQLVYPASLTALPTNLYNQDHVPMALNGANAVHDALEFGGWVLGSLALAVNQFSHLVGGRAQEGEGPLWAELHERFPPLSTDRPFAPEVREAAALVERWAAEALSSSAGRSEWESASA